jgi:hypothetical protein
VTTLLAVDPGTQVAGWAVFEDGVLRESGVIEVEGRDWVLRSDDVIVHLVDLADTWGVDHVVLEEPQQYSGGSAKARGAKASDSVLKLFGHVHALRAVLREDGVKVSLVRPTTWKGQVPKHITRTRMERRWPDARFGDLDDETDAVGLGTWWLEKRPKKGKRRRKRERRR